MGKKKSNEASLNLHMKIIFPIFFFVLFIHIQIKDA